MSVLGAVAEETLVTVAVTVQIWVCGSADVTGLCAESILSLIHSISF